MARNERAAVEEFAESLWFRYAKGDTSDGWRDALHQAHGAFMFRTFVGGNAASQSQRMLDDLADQCDARAMLAHAAELRKRVEAEKQAARMSPRQAGNASAVLLAVVACLVLVFGIAPPVARDALSVRVVTCPAPSDPAPSAQPAVVTDTI